MSQQRRSGERVIHVDKLVIHAKEVEIINEGHGHGHEPRPPRRDPWGFFWGRQRQMEGSNESFSEDRDGMDRE